MESASSGGAPSTSLVPSTPLITMAGRAPRLARLFPSGEWASLSITSILLFGNHFVDWSSPSDEISREVLPDILALLAGAESRKLNETEVETLWQTKGPAIFAKHTSRLAHWPAWYGKTDLDWEPQRHARISDPLTSAEIQWDNSLPRRLPVPYLAVDVQCSLPEGAIEIVTSPAIKVRADGNLYDPHVHLAASNSTMIAAVTCAFDELADYAGSHHLKTDRVVKHVSDSFSRFLSCVSPPAWTTWSPYNAIICRQSSPLEYDSRRRSLILNRNLDNLGTHGRIRFKCTFQPLTETGWDDDCFAV